MIGSPLLIGKKSIAEIWFEPYPSYFRKNNFEYDLVIILGKLYTLEY